MVCQQVDVAGAGIAASSLLVGQLLQGRDEGLLVRLRLLGPGVELFERPHRVRLELTGVAPLGD